ncbi:MAG: ribbon-helix-helix protein, CopG family [Tepidiformaceae bacterium]
MKRTTVSLPDTLAARLEAESRRLGLTVSHVVREALEQRLHDKASGDRYSFIGLVNKGGYPESDQAEEYLARYWMNDLLTSGDR